MATGGDSDLDRGTESASDETFDSSCSICARKNKKTEIQNLMFCIDCGEYFCSLCVKLHDNFPSLRHHKILDKSNFQPGSNVQFPILPVENCKVHSHKRVDMYCKQHDVVGCLVCMVMQHSACKDKEYIPDYINKAKVEDSSSVAVQLVTIACSLNKLQNTFLREKTNLKNRKDKSMQEIRKFRLEINQQLHQLEENTVKDLEGVFHSLNDQIDATLRELQAAITSVQSAQDSLKSAGINASQMFVRIKLANNVASRANDTVTTTQHHVCSTDISFDSNQKLLSLFNMVDVLGTISMAEQKQPQLRGSSHLPSVDKTQTNSTSHGNQSSLSSMQVKNSNKYTVREKSDTGTSCIESVCELDDGTIILSDCGRCKLKHVDSSYFLVRDSCIVPPFPYQVCTISSQVVAVCCNLANLIQFVSIGLTMQTKQQINTGFECVGLAYNDKKLFVSDGFGSVYVYTIAGERLQQFNKPGFFDRMFAESYFINIAVSSDGSTIYVPHYKKGLIILDKNGQLVGEFTGSKLKNARGVCQYKNNSVLVGGEDSNNLLQFTNNGKLIGNILKRDKGCYSLCYCKKTSKLIVGINDEIEVYDIN